MVSGQRVLIVLCLLLVSSLLACDRGLLDEEELKKKILYPLEEILIKGDLERMADIFADPIKLRDSQEKGIGTRSRGDFILDVGEKLVEKGILETYQIQNPRFSIERNGAIIRATALYQIKKYVSGTMLEGKTNIYLLVVKKGTTLVITETTELPW